MIRTVSRDIIQLPKAGYTNSFIKSFSTFPHKLYEDEGSYGRGRGRPINRGRIRNRGGVVSPISRPGPANYEVPYNGGTGFGQSMDHQPTTVSPSSYYYDYNVPSSGIIKKDDLVYKILSQPTLVIERQIEFMNLFIGIEQSNKYRLLDTEGNQLGYLIERDFNFFKLIMRQIYKLHRPFTVDLYDNNGNLLLTIDRPFSLINSHIKTFLPNINTKESYLIGESVQNWHLWRRKYNLFLNNKFDNENFDQYGLINSPFLSWEFPIFNNENKIIGSISKNFVGLMREFFTDTNLYVLRMDPSSFANEELQQYYYGINNNKGFSGKTMTIDERAVMLANAISIDFDYFSRHSRGPGGGLFLFDSGE
ncbi:hypothetical protein B5S28_g4268 [[Candida] boidinii]|uniref:Unnamed protein product n=1 Tax=Candida boidinii TaxID=5477 RepID=A0ACB5TUT4_CANBO|nr:hypothetical protein B5S28_g4268 [[Candida] boidinii]OWB64137.1 hypothetical protein B5S29_g5182 [[Candida] boidinii]OWB74869.1 hypothetical protein B5S31_g4701 [[Candida] boidinii]OWB79142.1 hypothetical protein B5S32_g3355 [[Candida] boidinii]GME95841.1 unnamed protein product [[Candida] boidinii]